MKRTPIRRSTPLSARRRPTIGTREQRERFKRRTTAAGECRVADDGPCDGDLQAHHVIPQEAIKKWARAQHVRAEEFADTLWDPANGLAVCRRHHDRHTLAVRRIPLAALDFGHHDFAQALRLEHLLDRYYRREENHA